MSEETREPLLLGVAGARQRSMLAAQPPCSQGKGIEMPGPVQRKPRRKVTKVPFGPKPGDTIDFEHKKRGPISTLPMSGTLQIAILGHFIVLQEKFQKARKSYQRQVKDYDRTPSREYLEKLDRAVDQIQEGYRFISRRAVRTALVQKASERAARLELHALYGWGEPRSAKGRIASGEPPGTLNPVLKSARSRLRTSWVDPKGHLDHEIRSLTARIESLGGAKEAAKEELEVLLSCGDRQTHLDHEITKLTARIDSLGGATKVAQEELAVLLRCAARQTYVEHRKALRVYSSAHRRRDA